MKEIKLTKEELEDLIYTYVIEKDTEHLVESCRDLEHADERDLLKIYNAFCNYLKVNGLQVYRTDEFNSFMFSSNLELKKLTANVDLDDMYFAMDLYGIMGGYRSFNDLHSFLSYRIPLSLRNINDMLEYTFEDEEEGEEDD